MCTCVCVYVCVYTCVVEEEAHYKRIQQLYDIAIAHSSSSGFSIIQKKEGMHEEDSEGVIVDPRKVQQCLTFIHILVCSLLRQSQWLLLNGQCQRPQRKLHGKYLYTIRQVPGVCVYMYVVLYIYILGPIYIYTHIYRYICYTKDTTTSLA